MKLAKKIQDTISETDSESKEDNEIRREQLNNEKDTENLRSNLSFNLLYKQLKRKLIDEEMNWNEKIKGCVHILLEGIISLAMQYLSKIPLLDYLKQWATKIANPQ